ncbi:MAG: site-specific integrase [Oscillospiraceae bacterium]|nr:site-specific integrase [Oscillospiraceae bacterium]
MAGTAKAANVSKANKAATKSNGSVGTEEPKKPVRGTMRSLGSGIQEYTSKSGELLSYKFRTCVGRDGEDNQVWRSFTLSADDPRIEDLTPARREKAVRKLKAEWEEEQRADFDRSHDKVDKRKVTFEQFVTDHWMKDHVVPGHTPSSIEFFEYTSAKAVAYFGKKKKLRSIDTEDVKRYLNYLKNTKTDDGKKFSPTSQKHFFGTLRNILRYAKRMHYIPVDPTEDLSQKEKPHRVKKQIDFLRTEDAVRFLDCLEEEPVFWQALLNLLLVTGLRRGEVCGLQWQDLNEKKLELSIVRNVTMDKKKKGEFNIGKTKTGESRVVPISTRICGLLTALRAQQKKNFGIAEKEKLEPDAFIFCNVENRFKPVRPDSVTTKVKRFVEKHNLPDVSPHDLRHSAAALALEAGTNLKAIQELLGHADPETTMKYYAGITEEAKRRSIEGTEDILFKKKKPDGKSGDGQQAEEKQESDTQTVKAS